MKNVTFCIALTVGALTWFIILWALAVAANRSNTPEPSPTKMSGGAGDHDQTEQPQSDGVRGREGGGGREYDLQTYSGQNAFGDYTGEQALIDKNTNELWYSAQDGFIARNIKCPSQFFGKSGISSSTIVAVKEIHFAITLPELSARMCLNRQIEPPRSGSRRLDSFI